MNYKKVDFSTWPRGDLFQFYMDHMRVVMSLTVDMDVAAGPVRQAARHEVLSGHDLGGIPGDQRP